MSHLQLLWPDSFEGGRSRRVDDASTGVAQGPGASKQAAPALLVRLALWARFVASNPATLDECVSVRGLHELRLGSGRGDIAAGLIAVLASWCVIQGRRLSLACFCALALASKPAACRQAGLSWRGRACPTPPSSMCAARRLALACSNRPLPQPVVLCQAGVGRCCWPGVCYDMLTVSLVGPPCGTLRASASALQAERGLRPHKSWLPLSSEAGYSQLARGANLAPSLPMDDPIRFRDLVVEWLNTLFDLRVRRLVVSAAV